MALIKKMCPIVVIESEQFGGVLYTRYTRPQKPRAFNVYKADAPISPKEVEELRLSPQEATPQEPMSA